MIEIRKGSRVRWVFAIVYHKSWVYKFLKLVSDKEQSFGGIPFEKWNKQTERAPQYKFRRADNRIG